MTQTRDPRTGTLFEEGAGHVYLVNATFKVSSYTADLTMNNMAQVVTIAPGTTNIRFVNLGATTEAVRIAFGIDATDAGDNLNIVTNAATTGYYLPAIADAGSGAEVTLGIPANATHVAVSNAVAGDTNTVTVSQGV